MSSDFEKAIRDGLSRNASLADFVEVLREYHRRGMTQQEALDTLQALRSGMGEKEEDRILEVMDIVSGFCRPSLRVWPE